MEENLKVSDSVIANLWSDNEAEGLSGLDLLVYQSRLVGANSALVLWGGGNTSLKIWERDFRGRETYILRVKGSGSDLKSVTRKDFPGVRLDDVLPLMEREEMGDDEMVAYLENTLLEPSSPRPSIETLLHAFIPATSVVHTHADAILSLTNNANPQEVLAEVYGDELALVPYRRPGFLLSKAVGEAVRARPDLKGVVLLNHGLITWHDDPREAYCLHIEMVDRAARYAASKVTRNLSPPLRSESQPIAAVQRREIAAALAPRLRGLVGAAERGVLRFHDSDSVVRFVTGQAQRSMVSLDRLDAVLEQGAATPDHILNTKRTPLLIRPTDPTDATRLEDEASRAYERWVEEYRAYYERHKSTQDNPPPILPAAPRVVVVEGIGVFTFGKDSRASTISADIFDHTIAIVEAAERLGGYRSLSQRDAFDAEYWPLELYKLTLAPPEKPLSRKVALVTGAVGAIGSVIARRFAQEGAHVVCADINEDGATRLAEELNAANLSNRAIGVAMDVSREESVLAAFKETRLEYGGLDIVVSNAGIAHGSPIESLELADWERSLAVNATGHFLVGREAVRVMKAQGIGGSLVFIATKNVPAPGKEFGAYSAAKAAEVQLARVLALEAGQYGVRSNIINPDAVFAGSGLWSDDLREERARAHGISPGELEEFYRARNILRVGVRADDVAEAALFFASDRSSRTTGAMLPVDGGLREAFPR
jgi:rhamnulose-1-phosphate aldolase/alcohol dehydrogenase